MSRAFIDESIRDGYMLCAASVADGDVQGLRKQVLGICREHGGGSGRLHMKNVRRTRQIRVIDDVARLEISSLIFVVKSRKIPTREARDMTLSAAIRHLADLDITRVTIESCGQDVEDRRAIIAATNGAPPFEYYIGPPTDPLLWVPDIHAWAWGRQGVARKRIKDRVSVTTLA